MLTDAERDELAARMNDDLRRRLLVVPRRPEGFHALQASAEELALYGFPPRPDDERALAVWENIVTAPKELIYGPFPLPGDLLPNYKIAVNWLTGAGHQETSANWSGAVIEAEAGRPFGQILGGWHVPRVHLPAGALPDVEYRCSVWIGLDGHARTSFSMPQVGTSQTVILRDGAPRCTYEAWYQWWVRDHAFPPVPIPDLDLDAGDEVACALDVWDSTHVGVSITNVTKGIPFYQPIVAPQEALATLPFFRIFSVEGVTAEWIAERPTKLGATDLHPLPDFDRVTFEGALVETAPPRLVRGLSPSRLIRMTERRPGQTVVLSRARLDKCYPHQKLCVGPGIEKDMGG